MFINTDRIGIKEIFQPARIVLAITNDDNNNRYNILPVAFNMYAGYNPLTFCFAVHDINYSYELFEKCDNFVLALPTESMAEISLICGTESGSEIDKFKKHGLNYLRFEESLIPGIKECPVNILCKKSHFIKLSDHALVVGEVIVAKRDFEIKEKMLLSVSNRETGYKILSTKGIHSLGVVDIESVEWTTTDVFTLPNDAK